MVATKTQGIEKQKALQAINHFFDQYKNSCNQKNAPTAANYQNILSHNFQNTSNGKLIGRNIQDFLKRIETVKSEYSHVEFSKVNDCLCCDNKATIHYDMSLTTKGGVKRKLNIMAIATFDGDEITEWTQVSHDTEKSHSK